MCGLHELANFHFRSIKYKIHKVAHSFGEPSYFINIIIIDGAQHTAMASLPNIDWHSAVDYLRGHPYISIAATLLLLPLLVLVSDYVDGRIRISSLGDIPVVAEGSCMSPRLRWKRASSDIEDELRRAYNLVGLDHILCPLVSTNRLYATCSTASKGNLLQQGHQMAATFSYSLMHRARHGGTYRRITSALCIW